MSTGVERIPRALRSLEDDIAAGLHLGALVHVWHAGQVVADVAMGQAREGVPMTTESLVIWWSMTKAAVAVAVAQGWERGLFALDDPVAAHVPEFGVKGKDRVTLRHCLTHTGGFRGGDLARGEWDRLIAAICDAPLEPRWVPGETAGYHLLAGTTMLAEVLRRTDGRPFEQYVRDEVFLPLGMTDCWVGIPTTEQARYDGRFGTMHTVTADGHVPLATLDDPDQLRRCSPAGGGRGPMSQLARLYRALLGGGELDGARILTPQTVEAITTPQRVDRVDKTFGIVNQWSLGFGVDAYNLGRHCSRRAFGHGGARSAQGMADPEHGLVVAVQTNGMCEPVPHQERFSRFFTALYEDLELVEPGAPGRDKPIAKYA